MSLRRRMTITVGVCVGVAVALAAVVAYVAVRSELRGQIDDELNADADRVTGLAPEIAFAGPPPGILTPPAGSDAGPAGLVRLISPGGDVLLQRGQFEAAVPPPGSAVEERTLTDQDAAGEHFRVLTAPTPDGGVVQVVRSLESADATLADLRTVLFLVVMGGAALGALAARLIANRMLAPVASLTDAAEHVSLTEDLSRRIEVTGDEEVARLARRFNEMLESLEASRADLDASHEEQRRLIADASHELRTPVTSLRTNIELIAGGRLEADDVDGALASAVAQTEELSDLIGDLMDLARGEAPAIAAEPVRLDAIVAAALERARRHAPGVTFTLRARPCVVEGAPDRITRAVNNLLDNAAEHAGGAPVEVEVEAARVTVRDHGPGVDPDEADRLFDRFYRGRGGRRRPGAGLGLAIVRQVAEAHGGTVGAANARGGGAVFSLQLRENGG